MSQPGYEILRNAITAANVNNDAEFDFAEKTIVIGGSTLYQLTVTYVSGNEYLRFDQLIDKLKTQMTFRLCELRGRGGDDGAIRLVCECDLGNNRYQLVYELPA